MAKPKIQVRENLGNVNRLIREMKKLLREEAPEDSVTTIDVIHGGGSNGGPEKLQGYRLRFEGEDADRGLMLLGSQSGGVLLIRFPWSCWSSFDPLKNHLYRGDIGYRRWEHPGTHPGGYQEAARFAVNALLHERWDYEHVLIELAKAAPR